jgi:hypothetical protein
MVDWVRRFLQRQATVPPPTPLTGERIEAGYRLFWTKIAFGWEAERRQMILERTLQVVQAPEFEPTALQRRFRVDGLDEQAHSGASLLALIEVLRALDNFESSGDNE